MALACSGARRGHLVSPSGLAAPPIPDSSAYDPLLDELEQLPYEIVCTEWNYNGWWRIPREQRPPFDINMPGALNAASHLNGLMRRSDRITLATQSMMIGTNWGITGVRVDEKGIYHQPQGLAIALYSQHHGQFFQAFEAQNLPQIELAYSTRPIQSEQNPTQVGLLDLVVTSEGDRLYLHAINRDYENDHPLNFDLSELTQSYTRWTQHTLQTPATGEWGPEHDLIQTTTGKTNRKGTAGAVTLPARSVSVIKIR
jgi:hypothetical protein